MTLCYGKKKALCKSYLQTTIESYIIRPREWNCEKTVCADAWV